MAENRIDPETAAASARELLERSVENRVAAVRVLVAATNDVDAADRAAKDARDAHAKAWDAAITSGWTDKELRATGARAPGPATTRTYTRRTAKPTTDTATQPAPTSDGEGQ